MILNNFPFYDSLVFLLGAYTHPENIMLLRRLDKHFSSISSETNWWRYSYEYGMQTSQHVEFDLSSLERWTFMPMTWNFSSVWDDTIWSICQSKDTAPNGMAFNNNKRANLLIGAKYDCSSVERKRNVEN